MWWCSRRKGKCNLLDFHYFWGKAEWTLKQILLSSTVPSSFCLQYKNQCKSCRKGDKPSGALSSLQIHLLSARHQDKCMWASPSRCSESHCSLQPYTCSLVQRKGAALTQLVIFPAYGTARAVWHCWWLHLHEVSSVKKLSAAANKRRKRVFPEWRKRVSEQWKIPLTSCLPNTGNSSDRVTSSSIHTTHFFRYLGSYFPITFVQRNFFFLNNNISLNFPQYPWKKKTQVSQESMYAIQ